MSELPSASELQRMDRDIVALKTAAVPSHAVEQSQGCMPAAGGIFLAPAGWSGLLPL